MSQVKLSVSSLLCSFLLLCASITFAVPIATVTHLSGPLVCHAASGATRSLVIGSPIESGETVETARRTYARLKFTDGSDVTLKPGTKLQVERYAYEANKPTADVGSFKLLKGGLRTLSGLIGKRGNMDSYQMKTPTATIGIRGTVYDVQFCQDDSQDSSCGSMQPGLYLAVSNGKVVITNSDGVKTTIEVQAGQYVYVKDATTPPVLLPSRPDIPFNPPPSVSSSSASQNANQTGGGDCSVQ